MAAVGPATVAAILVAAGSGTRLGSDVPKAFVRVGACTLLEHAAARFAAHPRVRDLVIVAPASSLAEAAALVPAARVVAGGETRQQSVSCGLAALASDVDAVLVHDVARAFVPAEVLDRVLDALAVAEAAIPVLPVTDTVRRTDPSTGELRETVDRTTLAAVQTPQGFWRAPLEAAHAGASPAATDDAVLVEARGGRVVGVRGDTLAFKITYRLDLLLAEAVVAQRGTAQRTEWHRD